jgi:hypothetical protein
MTRVSECRTMSRKGAAFSVTSLLLLMGVCATLVAMGSVPFRGPGGIRDVDWETDSTLEFVAMMAATGMLVGYIRFDRARYIVWGGILGLVMSILLQPIAALTGVGENELVVSGLAGILGLAVFQYFLRRSRRPSRPDA